MSENSFEVNFKDPIYTILDIPLTQRVIARIEMTKNRMFPLVMRNAKHFLIICPICNKL